MRVKGPHENTLFNAPSGRVTSPLELSGSRSLEIQSLMPNAVNHTEFPEPQMRLWPIARKVMTELRDRSYPFIRSWKIRLSKSTTR